MQTRIEKDSLGQKDVPAKVYYGIQTLRAVENFPISGLKAHPKFIWATVMIKRAAAEVHLELGLLKPKVAKAIIQASDEILAGKFQDQFVVDVFQAGAGTSHNMNANEVIANRAIEILGRQKGDYRLVHPNDHVNMGQSTNDVFPTAMRLACLALTPELLQALKKLEMELSKKAAEFDHILTSARTHLQDAVPIRLGQEFGAYAAATHHLQDFILHTLQPLKELGIGGSAAGTGLNTHPRYRDEIVTLLSQKTGFNLKSTDNLFETMNNMAPFIQFSAAIKNVAAELIRFANDFRLLSSGPKTGIAEIKLPAVQPGSSIMPGKVNPVMAEMLNMVAFQVIGNDTTITLASQAGQLQLNVMMPVIIFNLLWSLDVLINAINSFTEKCVKDIEANEDKCKYYSEKSVGLSTILNTYIGYEKAAEVVKESMLSDKTIKEIIVEKGLLSIKELENIFALDNFTKPGIPGK